MNKLDILRPYLNRAAWFTESDEWFSLSSGDGTQVGDFVINIQKDGLHCGISEQIIIDNLLHDKWIPLDTLTQSEYDFIHLVVLGKAKDFSSHETNE